MNLKKKIIITTSVIVLGVIGGVSAEMVNKPTAGADTSPLVTEVDHQNDRLNNHEARITNLESDTKDLQSNTHTTPSSNRVSVPAIRDATPASDSNQAQPTTSTLTPITIVSFKEIPLDADNSDCEYTYTDGTKYVFDWKRTDPQGTKAHDYKTGEDYFLPSTHYSGYCDQRAIGQPKAN